MIKRNMHLCVLYIYFYHQIVLVLYIIIWVPAIFINICSCNTKTKSNRTLNFHVIGRLQGLLQSHCTFNSLTYNLWICVFPYLCLTITEVWYKKWHFVINFIFDFFQALIVNLTVLLSIYTRLHFLYCLHINLCQI